MGVDAAATAHQRIDIGHRHGEPHAAIGQGFGPGQLVQVERVVVVDREPLAAAQITDVARARRAVLGKVFGLAQHFGREHRLEAVRAHFIGGNLGEVGSVHGDRGGGGGVGL